MTQAPAGSHLRFNPLTGTWILVAPTRGRRPQSEKPMPPIFEAPAMHDPHCFLCPGNLRASGIRNPDYAPAYVFDNDFPALSPQEIPAATKPGGLIAAQPERGLCRVMCYSQRHDLGPAQLDLSTLARAVDGWAEQFCELASLPWINHVQIFENHGPLAGASSPHPHSQIWATAHVPADPLAEVAHQKRYFAQHDSCLLCDYAKLESALKGRIVCENDAFLALVPYWALWPFETMVLSKRHLGTIADLHDIEKDQFADILKQLTTRYDNLFKAPFAYSMGLHQAPVDGALYPECHFHAHYYSPMKSVSVQKVLAGYELAAGRERDDLPEAAAARLRAASDKHYLDLANPVSH